MPPKKKPVKTVKHPPIRSGKPLNFWVDEKLRAALDAYLESARPTPTLTSALSVAVEEFLAARGFWPQPADDA